MPRAYKLLFAGPMGAGKTTAIKAISHVPPVLTEVANHDRAQHGKATTTVAMDYGEMNLETGDRICLYGTPGQTRLDFMWNVLARGALGAIVLIDNSQPDPIAQAEHYLRAFAGHVGWSRLVLGVGRTETHPQPSLDDYARLSDSLPELIPMFSVDVRRQEDVALLIDALLCQIEAERS